jgi:hypothetical protein
MFAYKEGEKKEGCSFEDRYRERIKEEFTWLEKGSEGWGQTFYSSRRSPKGIIFVF